jgi:hypothetical protein
MGSGLGSAHVGLSRQDTGFFFDFIMVHGKGVEPYWTAFSNMAMLLVFRHYGSNFLRVSG